MVNKQAIFAATVDLSNHQVVFTTRAIFVVVWRTLCHPIVIVPEVILINRNHYYLILRFGWLDRSPYTVGSIMNL